MRQLNIYYVIFTSKVSILENNQGYLASISVEYKHRSQSWNEEWGIFDSKTKQDAHTLPFCLSVTMKSFIEYDYIIAISSLKTTTNKKTSSKLSFIASIFLPRSTCKLICL
uniref:AlNc14C44G3617 protein n=1 Tax=Albugo laibachii Nc14 TaxID=890382 RepID=F0WA88_9STRA|nr:AlNc14C44G3617 [Albugo laibachii Nc14]|eukprot:CCA18058.1 AlNc14C44G3617 [Albugo laibachii Nc14]